LGRSDNSPDGTGRLAERLAGELGWVEVLHRAEKEGLGAAYTAGLRRALALGAELVVTMDCDFSHDPAAVPGLIAAAEEADLVLGSRYTRGGSDGERGLTRHLISLGGSCYARTVLGLRIRDVTAGFKCLRRSMLEQIELDRIRSRGYAFSIELTYRAVRAGARVVEVPISFAERAAARR